MEHAIENVSLNTHMHTYIHTCIHTYTHAYIHSAETHLRHQTERANSENDATAAARKELENLVSCLLMC